MSSANPPYNILELSCIEEGVPIVCEGTTPDELSESHLESYRNKEEMGTSEDVNELDDSTLIAEMLQSGYEHLRRVAEEYIRTSHRALKRIRLKRRRIEQCEKNLRSHAELIASSTISPIVKLNIGGMRFHVQQDTLLQFSTTIFHLLIGDQFVVQKDELGYIFLDRDPWLFRELLFLLRERCQWVTESKKCGCSYSPQGGLEHLRFAQLPPVERQRVLEEARYYGLNELVTELFTIRFQWQQCVLVHAPMCGYVGGCLIRHESDEKTFELPVGSCFATAVRLHDSVYLFGGCAEQEAVLNSLYRLQLDCENHESCGESLSENENGGNTGSAPDAGMRSVSYELIKPFVDVEDSSPTAPGARSGHAMVLLYDRYILLLYGNDLHRHLGDAWVYRVSRNTWTQVKLRGATVETRSGHSLTVVQDRIFLIGGKKLFGQQTQLFAEVFEGHFSPSRMELTWRLVSWPQHGPTRMQVERTSGAASASPEEEEIDNDGFCNVPLLAYHTAVEYKGRYIVVYGGLHAVSGARRDSNDGRWDHVLSDSQDAEVEVTPVYQFDTQNFMWRRLCTSVNPQNLVCSDIPRSGHVALRCDDDMYIMGSYMGHLQLEIFRLSLLSLTWRRIETTVKPEHILPCGRALPSAVLLPPTIQNPHPMIFLFGGYNVVFKQYFNDVYTLTL